MTGLIHRIFGHSDVGLVCGRCERLLEGHSEADCARKLSRRWFLGATLGAVAGAVVAPALPNVIIGVDPALPGSEAIVISRYLYRIQLEIWRGGNVHKYVSDGASVPVSAGYLVAAKAPPPPSKRRTFAESFAHFIEIDAKLRSLG